MIRSRTCRRLATTKIHRISVLSPGSPNFDSGIFCEELTAFNCPRLMDRTTLQHLNVYIDRSRVASPSEREEGNSNISSAIPKGIHRFLLCPQNTPQTCAGGCVSFEVTMRLCSLWALCNSRQMLVVCECLIEICQTSARGRVSR